jgi:hypothetical protein
MWRSSTDSEVSVEQIGFNAWFGQGVPDTDAAAKVRDAISGLGFERQTGPSPVPQVTRFRVAGAAGYVSVAIESGPPWASVALHPIKKEFRQSFGDERLRVVLRQLCEKLNATLGRTYGESLHGVVNRHEVESGPEWLDWFQYWSPAIISRWGIDRIKTGPFHLVELAPNGACAITLYKGPEDPEQMALRAKAAEYLGIPLRRRVGPPL